MILRDTSLERHFLRQVDHEGSAGATRRAPLAPERPVAAGYVDRTERMSARDLNAPCRKAAKLPVGEPSELQIHRGTVELLGRCALAGVFWFHVPNGEKRDRATGGKLKGMGTIAGMPDLFVIGLGRFGCLEFKKRGGKVSPDQLRVQALLVGCGVDVRTVYSIDEAADVLRAWGFIR